MFHYHVKSFLTTVQITVSQEVYILFVAHARTTMLRPGLE